jgi:hypothetical protein
MEEVGGGGADYIEGSEEGRRDELLLNFVILSCICTTDSVTRYIMDITIIWMCFLLDSFFRKN